jgi:predicted nucleotidyltransferase component of viral defense system
LIRKNLVFRGGTALNKIYINPPARYSEDIDLVQISSSPIGPLIDGIRKVLKSWLGEPIRKITTRSVKLIYKYQSIEGNTSKA